MKNKERNRTNTFGKGMNSLILHAMDQIASLLFFFYKDGFGIKQPTKFDMWLEKEIKQKRQDFLLLKF